LLKGGKLHAGKENWLLGAAFTLLPVFASLAQDNTSRLIPFSLTTSLAPQTTEEVVVELWDAASGGSLIFDEAHAGRKVLKPGSDWASTSPSKSP